MHRLTALALACLVAALRMSAVAQDDGAATTIEEITITGRYPGPPLWRVSAGEHALFVFGDLSPVPKGLDWDPRNAQRAIAAADTVISAPRVSAGTFNPIRLFRLFLRNEQCVFTA